MRNCTCGNQVASNARFCPKCGHRFTSGITKFVAGLLVFLVVVIIIAVLSNPDNSTQTRLPSQTAVSAPESPSTGNVANDRLLALGQRAQAAALSAAVNDDCAGKRVFYMGSSSTDHAAYWSIGCANGKSYMVQINADATGSTKVLDCSVYKLVTKMSCFAKLEK